MTAVREITITRPSDFHQHLRDGGLMSVVANMVFDRFANALVMPNLQPPVTTYQHMAAYRHAILSERPTANPIMTLYLTDELQPSEINLGAKHAWFAGVKYYPRGLTTNSDSGVAVPADLWTPGRPAFDALLALADCGRVLLLHAADGFDRHGDELDPFDQEPHFIRETLPRIIDAHPELKISVEHMSTMQGAEFIFVNGGERLGCSLTAHHLLLDRRDMLRGGMRPNRFWWPIIQGKDHRDALRGLVEERLPFVWLGSDSAPHRRSKKLNECCSGGVLMAHAGIELYAEAFAEIDALDYLEAFASINGCRFFKVPIPTDTITLREEPWIVRNLFMTASGEGSDDPVVPFRYGEEVKWSMVV